MSSLIFTIAELVTCFLSALAPFFRNDGKTREKMGLFNFFLLPYSTLPIQKKIKKKQKNLIQL